MKSKKLSETIIKTFKKWFVLTEPEVLLDSEYIIESQVKNSEDQCLLLREDGKTMCLRQI